MSKNFKSWFTPSAYGYSQPAVFGGDRKKVIHHGTLTMQVPVTEELRHCSMPHVRFEYFKDYINAYMVLTREEMVAVHKALGKALKQESL
jgi:hypothetical protein